MNSVEHLRVNAEKARTVCLVSLAVLLVLFLWQALVELPEAPAVKAVVVASQVLPFLLVLPGMLRRRWRSFAWMLLFLNLYFVAVVLRLFQNPGEILDWLLLILLSILFTAALLFVRWTRIAEAQSE